MLCTATLAALRTHSTPHSTVQCNRLRVYSIYTASSTPIRLVESWSKCEQPTFHNNPKKKKKIEHPFPTQSRILTSTTQNPSPLSSFPQISQNLPINQPASSSPSKKSLFPKISSPPPQSPPNRSRRHTPSNLHPSAPLILIPTTPFSSFSSSWRVTSLPLISTTAIPLQNRLRCIPAAHRSSPFGGEVETD